MDMFFNTSRYTGCIASLLLSYVLLTGCSNPNQSDIDTLKALYKSTNGENWRKNENWNSEKPLNTWYGIKTNAEGAVTEIDLESNYLKGRLPENVTGLKKLKVLNIGSSSLNGPLPPVWLESQSMEKLKLHNCGFTGSLPLSITKLKELSYLYLYGNHFTGAIPVDLYQLTELRELRINSNQLSGIISPKISALKKLRVLHLNYNQLSGNIPDEISQIPYMNYLDISNNQLTGPIPKSIAKLEYLDYLHASDNLLTGPIPLALLSNDDLYIDVTGNPKISSIPIEFQNQERVSISFDKPKLADEKDPIKQWFKEKEQEQIEKYGMSVDMTPELDLTK